MRLRLYDRGNVKCPICLAAFTRKQTSAGKVVTLEHVPPKFLGGQARCLICKACNAETGRDIDQIAAASKQPTKVTVNILGKHDSFYLSKEGKEITPAFGGYTQQDMRKLRDSKSGTFTMSLRIPNRQAVATSWLKSAYLAVFSLLGPVEAYEYVRSKALVTVRQQILDPLNHGAAGNYVDVGLGDIPNKDILLVADPVPCWMIKIDDKIVVLPLDGDNTVDEPLSELRRCADAKSLLCRANASWMFQTFGKFNTIGVHLEGADRMGSLLGLTIRGILPNGRAVEGTCIRHMGEYATLLCKEKIWN